MGPAHAIEGKINIYKQQSKLIDGAVVLSRKAKLPYFNNKFILHRVIFRVTCCYVLLESLSRRNVGSGFPEDTKRSPARYYAFIHRLACETLRKKLYVTRLNTEADSRKHQSSKTRFVNNVKFSI